MLSSHLAFALLSAMAMASPVPQKRAETTCTDINYCEFKGCWTEMDGQSWCSPDDGNTASTFSLNEILFDTGMDLKKRKAYTEGIPSSLVLEAIGRSPTFTGGAEGTGSILNTMSLLAKLSATHAIKMRNVISWGVEIGVESDRSVTSSFYYTGEGSAKNGKIVFSASNVLDGSQEQSMGFVAHEMGHAVFDHGGYSADLQNSLSGKGDLANEDIYGNLAGMVNEPFAGIFAQRSTLYQHIDNPDKSKCYWNRLVWSWDVNSLFRTPDEGYWKYYGLHNPKSYEGFQPLLDIGVNVLLPRLAEEYGLTNDPYLRAGIEAYVSKDAECKD